MYQGEYTLIGQEVSLFTRKLEAQLRFQRLPWRWQLKTQELTPEIEARARTHFIPLLETPDNWLIHDTIAIGPMLSQRYPEYAVVPQTPLQRGSAFILEDFFNHWLGRSAVHSRWCYPDNVAWVGLRMGANGVLGRHIDESLSPEEQKQLGGIGQMMYEGFGKNVCDINGVPVEQSEAVQADFAQMLGVLAEHFKHSDFLLGPRPCIADFALAGASKAHYITDPEPRSWLGEHKQMLTEYTEQFFSDQPIDAGDWPENDQVPETLSLLLDYIQRTYLVMASANIAGGKAGEKYYEFDFGYGPTKARTQGRLNKARLHVRDELTRIDADKHADIADFYGSRGILQHYLAE
jgi:glutathione S-transferase